MHTKTFHARLRRFKEEKGYSSKRLATKLNVTNRTVNSWLNGDSQPKADQVYKLSEIFGITPNELYYDSFEDDSLSVLRGMMVQIPENKRTDALTLMVDLFKVAMPHITHVN